MLALELAEWVAFGHAPTELVDEPVHPAFVVARPLGPDGVPTAVFRCRPHAETSPVKAIPPDVVDMAQVCAHGPTGATNQSMRCSGEKATQAVCFPERSPGTFALAAGAVMR